MYSRRTHRVFFAFFQSIGICIPGHRTSPSNPRTGILLSRASCLENRQSWIFASARIRTFWDFIPGPVASPFDPFWGRRFVRLFFLARFLQLRERNLRDFYPCAVSLRWTLIDPMISMEEFVQWLADFLLWNKPRVESVCSKVALS